MTAHRTPSPPVLLLAGLLVAGCAGDEGPGAGGPAGYPERLDTAEVVLTLGRVEGPPEYLFGAVTSLAADARGRIYVADRIGSTVRVYAPDGEHRATLGGEGEGPGEYSWPADLAFGPGGRLYVRDARRITVLDPSGDGGIADSVVDAWRLPSRGNPRPRRSGVDSAGRYLHPGYRFPPDGGARYFYLVFEDGRHAGDTVPVPPYPGLGRTRSAYYWLTEGRTGKMVDGLSRVPFQPAPAWDVTPRGTVIGGDGAGPGLVETDAAGDTVAAVDLPGPGSRPVPDEAEQDSLAALEARIDSLPVPLPEVVNLGERVPDRDFPRTLPTLLDVVVARDGRIWVERWPPEGRPETRWYDVLRPDGGYVRSVVVPEPIVDEPPPFITEDAFYGVVTDPGTGIQRVVALSFAPVP